MTTHLYCVLPHQLRGAIPAGLTAWPAARVRALAVDGLVAWVSDIERGAPVSIEGIRAHNDVVEAAMETGSTPVPARYGQRFDDDRRAAIALGSRADVGRTRCSATMQGFVEMTVSSRRRPPDDRRPRAGAPRDVRQRRSRRRTPISRHTAKARSADRRDQPGDRRDCASHRAQRPTPFVRANARRTRRRRRCRCARSRISSAARTSSRIESALSRGARRAGRLSVSRDRPARAVQLLRAWRRSRRHPRHELGGLNRDRSRIPTGGRHRSVRRRSGDGGAARTGSRASGAHQRRSGARRARACATRADRDRTATGSVGASGNSPDGRRVR